MVKAGRCFVEVIFNGDWLCHGRGRPVYQRRRGFHMRGRRMIVQWPCDTSKRNGRRCRNRRGHRFWRGPTGWWWRLGGRLYDAGRCLNGRRRHRRFKHLGLNRPWLGQPMAFLKPAVPAFGAAHHPSFEPDGTVGNGIACRAGGAGDNHQKPVKHAGAAPDKGCTDKGGGQMPFFHIDCQL